MAVWLRGGRICDVGEGRYRDGDIRIETGRITALGQAGRPSGDDRVIDVAGAFLLPGLIDCHVRWPPSRPSATSAS